MQVIRISTANLRDIVYLFQVFLPRDLIMKRVAGNRAFQRTLLTSLFTVTAIGSFLTVSAQPCPSKVYTDEKGKESTEKENNNANKNYDKLRVYVQGKEERPRENE